MRFLVREQPYEQLLAAGRLRYRQNGAPTGAVEHWRATRAPDGHRILRVDLDARAAESGRSYLYHWVQDGAGRPLRLTYLCLLPDAANVRGKLLFSGPALLNSRHVAGQHQDEEVEWDETARFFFPSVAGLLLALAPAGPGAWSAWSLDMHAPVASPGFFALRRQTLTIQAIHQGWAGTLPAQPAQAWQITWDDQSRSIWLDDYGWPLAMQRQDGLTAQRTWGLAYASEGVGK